MFFLHAFTLNVKLTRPLLVLGREVETDNSRCHGVRNQPSQEKKPVAALDIPIYAILQPLTLGRSLAGGSTLPTPHVPPSSPSCPPANFSSSSPPPTSPSSSSAPSPSTLGLLRADGPPRGSSSPEWSNERSWWIALVFRSRRMGSSLVHGRELVRLGRARKILGRQIPGGVPDSPGTLSSFIFLTAPLVYSARVKRRTRHGLSARYIRLGPSGGSIGRVRLRMPENGDRRLSVRGAVWVCDVASLAPSRFGRVSTAREVSRGVSPAEPSVGVCPRQNFGWSRCVPYPPWRRRCVPTLSIIFLLPDGTLVACLQLFQKHRSDAKSFVFRWDGLDESSTEGPISRPVKGSGPPDVQYPRKPDTPVFPPCMRDRKLADRPWKVGLWRALGLEIMEPASKGPGKATEDHYFRNFARRLR